MPARKFKWNYSSDATRACCGISRSHYTHIRRYLRVAKSSEVCVFIACADDGIGEFHRATLSQQSWRSISYWAFIASKRSVEFQKIHLSYVSSYEECDAAGECICQGIQVAFELDASLPYNIKILKMGVNSFTANITEG
ncbi:hypothetical protein XU18_4602 [Perkinsela sp. CCAP 1560/4]|nr:hypothetical protein XU18_4602 [Perkinsela sp. CCAP 1560/4]|eukprot:KNH04088.1 hypothetical protein XU18_4602 [Perkinsela sp. CCAP 1560/4]